MILTKLIQGKQYTMYEATQTQRKLERSIRTTKRKILPDEEIKDDEHLLYDQIRLRRLNEEYTRFSKAAGLPTQRERAQVVGYGRGHKYSRSRVGDSKYFGIKGRSKIGLGIPNILESGNVQRQG